MRRYSCNGGLESPPTHLGIWAGGTGGLPRPRPSLREPTLQAYKVIDVMQMLPKKKA